MEERRGDVKQDQGEEREGQIVVRIPEQCMKAVAQGQDLREDARR